MVTELSGYTGLCRLEIPKVSEIHEVSGVGWMGDMGGGESGIIEIYQDLLRGRAGGEMDNRMRPIYGGLEMGRPAGGAGREGGENRRQGFRHSIIRAAGRLHP